MNEGIIVYFFFLTPGFDPVNNEGEIKCKLRLGGVLKYYYRKAA